MTFIDWLKMVWKRRGLVVAYMFIFFVAMVNLLILQPLQWLWRKVREAFGGKCGRES